MSNRLRFGNGQRWRWGYSVSSEVTVDAIRRLAGWEFQKGVAVREHRSMKTLGRHLAAAVPGRKQPPRSIQKLLGPSFRFRCSSA